MIRSFINMVKIGFRNVCTYHLNLFEVLRLVLFQIVSHNIIEIGTWPPILASIMLYFEPSKIEHIWGSPNSLFGLKISKKTIFWKPVLKNINISGNLIFTIWLRLKLTLVYKEKVLLLDHAKMITISS